MDQKHEIERVSLELLIPYAKNSRTHSDAQVAQIAASIREFGFTNPVLIDADSGIIAGHGRTLAARKLGMNEVPCIRLDYLTETQRRAYVIADNKLALNAGWDDALLALEINDLSDMGFDIDIIGFSVDEITAMSGAPDFSPATEDEQGKLDELDPKYITCPHCRKEFDLREVE